MNNQDQLNLAMQAVCLIQQNQMLKQQNAMLRDLIDRVDSMGDLVWRMNLRHSITHSQADQTGQADGEEALSGPQEGYLPQTRGQEGLI